MHAIDRQEETVVPLRSGTSRAPAQEPLRWPFNYLVGRDPLAAALVCAVPGLLCCGLSVWLGIDFIDSPPWAGAVHEVGYLAALNWSVGFTVLAPCAIYYMILSLRCVDPLIARLRDQGMLAIERPAQHQPIAKDDPQVRRTLTARWRSKLHSTRAVVLVCSILAIGIAAGSWYKYSIGVRAPAPVGVAAGVTANESVSAKPIHAAEVDWLVACRWTDQSCELVAAFGVLAFLMQAGMIVAFFLFAATIVAFSMFARELAPNEHPEEAEGESGRIILLPQAATGDPRRGFEAFESLTENILLSSAFSFGLFYLSRLWNVYLHSDAASLFDYALPFLAKPSIKDDMLWGWVAPFDESGFFVTIAGMLLFMLALVIPISVLRSLGQRAVRAAVGTDPTGELSAKLQDMKFWPLAFPGQGLLALVGVTCLLTLWIPALGICYFGVLAWTIARRAYYWFTLPNLPT